ncbi:MAG: pyruvate dehydrogenase (acetyl-transferring) E1 component subunit alpha [Dehalococcoidia bacterium]
MKVKERLSKAQMVDLWRQTCLIREFEERAAEQYMLGKIRGFLHLYIGEEAIAVGAMAAVRPQDYVVTHYRDHGHALARGLDPKAVMAELFGKATGCSKGKGGSMHLFDLSRNFLGGYAIVGGQLPIAAGLGLAISYKGEDATVLCILGDGALNEGEFHEAMNLCSIWKLPVLFLCENNLYGMGAPVWQTYALHDQIYQVADAYRMPGKRVDGMDVLAVREAVAEAREWCHQGKGPFFIEAQTYRFRGHSIADPVEYREKAEAEEWLKRDPVATFGAWLQENGLATAEELAQVQKGVEELIAEAVRFADESPFPEPAALYDDVYAPEER